MEKKKKTVAKKTQATKPVQKKQAVKKQAIKKDVEETKIVEENEDEFVFDVSDVVPEVIKEEKLDSEIDDDSKEGIKEYEALPKATLNELRTIRRHAIEEEKRQINKKDEKKKEESVAMEEVYYPAPALSVLALQWEKWLKYQKITPQQFLEKWPNHKFIHIIKEIIEWENRMKK